MSWFQDKQSRLWDQERGERERRERLSSADWRAGGALAQFRLMSGQLEVHHSALCTAPVSLNLCCRGPYPQPGHSPREALTLRPILLWQLRSSRSNAKRYCDVYMVTLYSCLLQQQGYVCAEPGRAGREKWRSRRRVSRKDGGYWGRKKKIERIREP